MVKENDPDVAMTCMVGPGRGRRSTWNSTCNQAPVGGPSSKGTSEGHVFSAFNDEVPLGIRNTVGAALLLFFGEFMMILLTPLKVSGTAPLFTL